MDDARTAPEDDPAAADDAVAAESAESADTDARADDAPGDAAETDEAELRRRVEETYDFEDFGPEDMAEMSADEWEAVFDTDTWITGDELLDRVERDLTQQIATRDVFAVLERVERDGERRLLAYSDEGYAMVMPDGSVEGFGTVLRDVKPTVALCSMESYDPPEDPSDDLLPDPDTVPEGSGELGNLMLQIVAGMQILAGLALFTLAGWNLLGPTQRAAQAQNTLIPIAAGIFFVLIGVFLFVTVANARLSDRFRAAEYRDRLRAVGLEDGERPDFLPIEDGDEVTSVSTGESRAIENR